MVENPTYWVSDSGCGAAWTFDDAAGGTRAFFAGNGGNVIFELLLDTVDLDAIPGGGSAELFKLGMQPGTTQKNDGLSCFDIATGAFFIEPFPTCGDKNGRENPPNPNPVTDADCGNGYFYDPTYSER